MKKLVLLLFFSFLFLQVFAQDTTSQMLTEESYLLKSRSQKKAGWLLLGGGVGLLVLAGATYDVDINPFGTPSSNSGSDNTVSTVLAVAGVSALIGGIASFVSSARNRKKAASLSVNNQPLILPFGGNWVKRTQPALSLKISL